MIDDGNDGDNRIMMMMAMTMTKVIDDDNRCHVKKDIQGCGYAIKIS